MDNETLEDGPYFATIIIRMEKEMIFSIELS